MSVQALSWVFDVSTARGADRLVLLSIANHADNKGLNSWPSIPTIARESGLGETRTKTAIKTLAAAGTLRVEQNAGGSADHRGDRRPNRYTILPFSNGGHPSDSRKTTQPVDKSEDGGSTGVTSDADGGHTGDREPSYLEQDRDLVTGVGGRGATRERPSWPWASEPLPVVRGVGHGRPYRSTVDPVAGHGCPPSGPR